MSETLYDWFADSARRHRHAEALRVAGISLTYQQLRQASDKLASQLDSAGLSGGRIGLLAARTPLAYLGYLAILRVGGTVVPLNPIFPPHRNAAIAERAGLRAVVLDPEHAPCLPPTGIPLISFHDRTGPVTSRPRADVPAYILFTSGSTGVPKGLPIRHANVAPYLAYNIDRYEVAPGSRLSQTFDLTFDPSVFDMFVTWGGGGTLVVPQRDELADPAAFANRHRLTHWFSVPSVVSLAARMRRLPAGCLSGLRWSLFAGEQLTLDQAAAWHRAAPGSVIENVYGPTELTVTCTGYRLPADPQDWPRTRNATVPIGLCYPHLQHVVLGSDGLPAAEGELCVRGAQRFDGYLDHRDNTGRFLTYTPGSGRPAAVQDLPTPPGPDHWYRTGDRVQAGDGGVLTHLGRLDSQVQVHGYRVELGEVEAVLRRHAGVQEAVVLFDGNDLRVVYTGTPAPADELAKWVAASLPAYMVPSRFTCVDLFPLNDNGKVDRRKLEALPC
jgi:amino acid adenylation domain-containing protein